MQLTPEPVPARGDLARLPFATLLAHAHALSTTGILTLRDEKKVFLDRGSPVRVESSIQAESSEAYLLEKGVVTSAELAQVRQFAAATGQGLSDALVSLGLVQVNELFEHARDLTRQRVIRCFELEQGSFAFERLERLGDDFLPVELDVAKLFVEGITLYYGRARIDDELPIDDDWRIYAVKSPLATSSATRIDTVDARLLQLASSGPSLRSITISLPLTAERLRQRLYVLYCLGLVGFGARNSLPPPRPAEHHRIPTPLVPEPAPAGVHRRIFTPFMPIPAVKPAFIPPTDAASATAPSPAHHDPAPMVSPTGRALHAVAEERHHPTPLIEARPSPPGQEPHASDPTGQRAPFGPEHISTIVGQPPPPDHAPRQRGDSEPGPRGPERPYPTRPSVPKAAPRPRTVSQLLEDADFARMSGDLDAALDALREAHRLEPQNPTVSAGFALTLLVSDPRKYAKEANRLAREARHGDPKQPLPYVVLGILMEQLGDRERARQLYRYATTLDSDCQEAQRRLDDLEQKQGGQK